MADVKDVMNADEVVEAVRQSLRRPEQQAQKVPLHDPFIGQAERDTLSSMGDMVGYGAINAFEEAVAELVGRKYAIAVSNGTAAIHLSLLALGVGPGTTVTLPSMTFAGVAAAVSYCGARPSCYDGMMVKFPPLYPQVAIGGDLMGWPRLPADPLNFTGHMIEDAAGSLGSAWDFNGVLRKAGAQGIASVFSFNHNKIVTTGGGGMVLTDDDGLAREVRHLATTAKVTSPFYYDHDRVGFNYRMGNINAALGLSQLKRLPEIMARKRALSLRYEAFFQGKMFCTRWPLVNRWLNAIYVQSAIERDKVLAALYAAGFQARALYTPIHQQAPYKDAQLPNASFPLAEKLFNQVVVLPSGASACARL